MLCPPQKHKEHHPVVTPSGIWLSTGAIFKKLAAPFFLSNGRSCYNVVERVSDGFAAKNLIGRCEVFIATIIRWGGNIQSEENGRQVSRKVDWFTGSDFDPAEAARRGRPAPPCRPLPRWPSGR